MLTMYNRNYGGFDYVRIHSELLTSVLNRKIYVLQPVTDGYTRPLYASYEKPTAEIAHLVFSNAKAKAKITKRAILANARTN